MASAAFHALILVALLWRPGSDVDPTPAGLPGTPGGGGGGGGPKISYVALAPPSAPQSAAASIPTPVSTPLPVPRMQPIARHEPRVVADLPTDIRPIQFTRTIGAGAGIGGGRGAGTGSGGGIGSGEGTGTGSGVGPGDGGDGGTIFPPTVRYTFLPPEPRPDAVQGQTFHVRFAVNAEGRVTDVHVEPDMDGGYRKQFVQTMFRFRFNPATLSDGTRVAGATILSFTL